jgi:hypothetical protein
MSAVGDGVTRLAADCKYPVADATATFTGGASMPSTIGKWLTVHVADADRLTHFSIAVDPARPDVIEKYVAVVYADPNLSAQYYRGESLYSFDEALARAAGLIAAKDALVVEDY